MNTPHILTDKDINAIEDEEYTIMFAFGPAKTGFKRLYLVWKLAGDGYQVIQYPPEQVQEYGNFYEAVDAYNEL